MPEGTQKTYEQFQRNIAPVSHLVTTLRRRSDSLCASDLPRAIDFAFIDGDHRYEAARADFQLIEPLITDRGMIALHDYRWFSGVTRVVGEALASGRWILEGKVENLCWLARPVGQRSS